MATLGKYFKYFVLLLFGLVAALVHEGTTVCERGGLFFWWGFFVPIMILHSVLTIFLCLYVFLHNCTGEARKKEFANVSLSKRSVLEMHRNRHENEVEMWKKKADQSEEKLRQEQNKLQEQRGMLRKEREEWQQQRENKWERRMEAKMR